MKYLIKSLAAACLLTSAQAANLAVGDPAPPLSSGEFVQGEAVKEFEKGKVYLVEFWATWCDPCVAVIPHLNELQKKFADKGLVVIGQNVWERDEAKLKPFIEKMGEKMTYRVALDDKSEGNEGKMALTWMKASGQDGIPATFIVDKKGDIAWIGHPTMLTERTINQVIEGISVQSIKKKYNIAINEQEMEAAAAALGELEALNDPSLEGLLPMMRLDIAVRSEDVKASEEQALAVLDMSKGMPDKIQAAYLLNYFVAELNRAEGLEGLDRKIPVKLGEEAAALFRRGSPEILMSLARAKFLAGDKDGAIATQQEAIRRDDVIHPISGEPKTPEEATQRENWEELKMKLRDALEAYKKAEEVPAVAE